jgi:asparagine synthase (glutamine-hydrolysing)
LSHRGPDGEGIYTDGYAGLGHRRLSVVDLSENARQPMSNEDSSIIIVFNGMIYNYKELREDLKIKHHQFKSQSDTEVIVHLYEEFGADCVKYLRGMFAFAIWDANKKELILARDRIGQKPLVYAEIQNHFLFASEPKSILASGIFNPQVNPLGLHSIFSYKCVPYPYTMFKAIYKLPPASVMVVNENGVKIDKYWKIQLLHKVDMDIGEAALKLEDLIDESVKMQLLGDVPIGAFLSGGIDSSLIATHISLNTPNRLKAFTVGFENDAVKDREFYYAESVAKRYNFEHRKITVDDDVINWIEKVVWHYDEPFAIPVALVNMKFCHEIKKDVTVALTGDGGDEIFAGYSGYYLWKLLGDADIFLKKNTSIIKFLSILNKLIPSETLKLLLLPSEEKRAYVKKHNADKVAGLLYSNKFTEIVGDYNVGTPLRELYLEHSPSHMLDGVLYMDLVLNDAHGICVFSDISGMANGLEIRAPFLDHHILEFAASLPVWMKINGKQRKYILRQLSRFILPRGVILRKKLGYGDGIPFRKWFMHEWKNTVKEGLFGSNWDELDLINQRRLKFLWDSHFSGRQDNFDILWTLFCYSSWYKVFFKEFDKWMNDDSRIY